MESERIKKVSGRTGSNYGSILLWVVGIIFFGILIVACYFFLGNQNVVNEETGQVNGSLWGQYGDFIGGIVGTAFAFLSLWLLVKTLRQQIDSSEEISKNNEKNNRISLIQTFDNTYYRLLELYEDALKTLSGDKDISKFVQDELVADFESGAKSPIQAFKDFYSKHREHASVYFRMIYRELQFLDKSNIPEEYKAQYSKIFRAQLSEAELLLLRYNAQTENGLNMQSYINRYNLLKHLPLFDILEFSKWKKEKHTQTELNGLDVMFYNLRQKIRKEFLNPVVEKSLVDFDIDSEIYKLRFIIESKRSKFKLELTKKNSKAGKSTNNESLDSAIGRYTNDEMKGLLEYFIRDVFLWSNNSLYNNEASILVDKGENKSDGNKTITFYATIENTKGYPLIASQKQMQNPNGSGKEPDNKTLSKVKLKFWLRND